MDGSATLVITLALAFYSIGVWSERRQGRLRPWHLAFFWLGPMEGADQPLVPPGQHDRRPDGVHGHEAVWAIWLIPYFSPMFLALGG